MKVIVARLAPKEVVDRQHPLGGVSFVVLVLFLSQSQAKIDPLTAVGIWLFDEGTGQVAMDSSPAKNDGEILGPKWVDGKIGKALEFNGVDDYVDCGEEESLNLVDHLTLTAWVKHQSGNDGYILMRNDPGDGVRQYGFLDYPSHETGVLDFFCHTAGGRVEMDNWQKTAIDDNNWHHVAITVDSPDVHLFVDGVDKGPDQLPDTMVSVDTSVWIGKRKPSNFPFQGIIDEVGIFNVALTEDDVNRVMTEGLSQVLAVSPAGKLATTWASLKNRS